MADLIPPLIIGVQLDASQLNAGVNAAKGGLNGLGTAATAQQGPLGSLGKTLGGLGLAFGAYQVIQFGKGLLDAAEAETVSNARLENITESMGLFGAEAGAVSTRLENLAQQTASNTGVDEESIKATQAKLMTFKELGKTADEAGGAFDRATGAAIDMAAAGFGTAETNAVQLGKALNDPIKGITALSRSGITFTEQEKEQIKTMVEHNDMLGAQEMVLGAIETQVGGTAEATATGTGKMGAAFEHLQETLGLVLMPAIEGMADGLGVAFGFIADNLPTVGTFIGVLAGLTIAFNALAIANAIENSQLFIMAAALLANPITWIVLGIAALAAGIVYLVTQTTFFQDAWAAMCKWVADAWDAVGKWLGQSIMNIAKFFGDLPGNIVKFITQTIPAVWKWFTELPGKIVDFIVKAAPVIWKWFSELPANMIKGIGDFVSQFLKVGSDIVNGILKGIQDGWNGVVKWLQEAVSNSVEAVKNWLGIKSPSTVFAEIGKNMALGMKQGIMATSDEVANAAMSMADSATVSASFGVTNVNQSATVAPAYFAQPNKSATTQETMSGGVSINAPVTVQTNANAQDISSAIVNAIKFNLPYVTTGVLA
jgi:hypothetical protein